MSYCGAEEAGGREAFLEKPNSYKEFFLYSLHKGGEMSPRKVETQGMGKR